MASSSALPTAISEGTAQAGFRAGAVAPKAHATNPRCVAAKADPTRDLGSRLQEIKAFADAARDGTDASAFATLVDAVAGLPIALAKSTVLGVDFTSKCNLRCVYCFQSQKPDYYYSEAKSLDIDDELIGNILRLIEQSEFGEILVGFAGETTILPKWAEYVGKLIDTGIPVTITTNLSKVLESDEAAVLARCSRLNVSIDVIDLKLSRKIRRKSDTRTIVYNLMQIKSMAEICGIPQPQIIICSVVSDQSVLELKKLIAFAVACKVDDISLMGLDTTYIEEFNRSAGGIVINDIMDLVGDEKTRVIGALTEALAFAEAKGVRVQQNEGVARLLRNRELSNIRLPRGWTRACMQPWMQPMIKANGGVEPCCHGFGEVGQIKDGGTFIDAFNSDAMVALRKGLLSGDMPLMCMGCSLPSPMKPIDFAESIVSRLQDHQDGFAFIDTAKSRPAGLLERVRGRRAQGQSWVMIGAAAARRIYSYLGSRTALVSR